MGSLTGTYETRARLKKEPILAAVVQVTLKPNGTFTLQSPQSHPKTPPPSYSLRRRSREGVAGRAEIGVAYIPSILSVVSAGSHTGGGRNVFERRVILGWQAMQVVSEFMSGEGYIVNNPPSPTASGGAPAGVLPDGRKLGLRTFYQC